MFDVKLMAGALGAEIHGIDLTKNLTAKVKGEIRKLLLKHQVIFFRNQDIKPAKHKELAQIWGPLQTHPAYRTVAGFLKLILGIVI